MVKNPTKKGHVTKFIGTLEVLLGIIQLLIGIYYLLSTFIAKTSGNIPELWLGNMDYIFTFSYVYIVYGILELVGGIGVRNLNNASRYLLAVLAGIKLSYIFINTVLLNLVQTSGIGVFFAIYSLYYLFIFIYLLIKKDDFKSVH